MAGTIKGGMDEEKLIETNSLWDLYYYEWVFLNAAYEGARALIKLGALYRHERESTTNYQRRANEAYGLSYSRSIIEILNSFLFKNEFDRQLAEKLANDPLFLLFMSDCNLQGTSFDQFFINWQKMSSIQGHAGILVDKPFSSVATRQEEIDKRVYPYLAGYAPTNILDWEWERDEFNRPYLSYLKVIDNDGQYRIWTTEYWEVWELAETEATVAISQEQATQVSITGIPPKSQAVGRAANLINEGENQLGEIPFIWLFNARSTIDPEVGVSDITDIARIDASIIRNLSQIEEIIDYAAFPMMRMPMKEAGAVDKKDEVGVVAVLEFDPENPDSKPDWLDSSVAEPVDATLSLIAKKIEEIYRSSNIGGLAATEISSQAKSGVALKTEFQMLNSKLVQKGKNVAKAEREAIRLWLKWQNMEELNKDTQIGSPDTYEIEDLAADLENMMTGGTIVSGSETFKKELQKATVRMLLPSLDTKMLSKIDKEIDAGKLPTISSSLSRARDLSQQGREDEEFEEEPVEEE